MTRSPADFGHFTKLEENMNSFTYSYPVKVYFGEKAAAKNLAAELANIGPNVMLAYGGGSIKKNGVYAELLGILKDAGKTVTEFAGIMSNPTYAKVQEGAARRLRHRLLQDRLRSGKAGQRYLGTGVYRSQTADRVHPYGCCGHRLRNGRGDE